MSSTKEGVTSGDRLSGVVVATAILVAACTAVGLVSANANAAGRLRANQAQGTNVPVSGALLGQESLGGPEWKATEGDQEAVIMFGLTARGSVGDIEYWEEVASLSKGEGARADFVGLCTVRSACDPQAGGNASMTVLTSMDLAQFHALAIASTRSNALVYRGGNLEKVLPLQSDRQSFAKSIGEALVGEQPHAGGE